MLTHEIRALLRKVLYILWVVLPIIAIFNGIVYHYMRYYQMHESIFYHFNYITDLMMMSAILDVVVIFVLLLDSLK